MKIVSQNDHEINQIVFCKLFEQVVGTDILFVKAILRIRMEGKLWNDRLKNLSKLLISFEKLR